MADRRRLSERDLADALTELRDRIAYPRTPDLASTVAGRLTKANVVPAVPSRGDRSAARLSRRGHSLARRTHRESLRRSLVAVAAALVLALTGVLVASPSARKAVAGWLGLPGVRIELTPSPGTAPTRLLGDGLRLGKLVPLSQARHEVGFDPLLPVTSGIGRPDEVYVDASNYGGQVFLVYRERRGLPRAAETGAALLLSEFRGDVHRDFVRKSIGPETKLEAVTVQGEPGFWLEGSPHEVLVVDESGQARPDTIRLAGNVLLWQRGNLTLRLESALGKEQALRIAESLR